MTNSLKTMIKTNQVGTLHRPDGRQPTEHHDHCVHDLDHRAEFHRQNGYQQVAASHRKLKISPITTLQKFRKLPSSYEYRIPSNRDSNFFVKGSIQKGAQMKE